MNKVGKSNTQPKEDTLPPLPEVGPIGFASVVDIELYKTWLQIGPHLPGVRDVALWTTDQMRAYARAALAAPAPQAAPQSLLMKLAGIAAVCTDPDTTDALDRLIAEATHGIPAPKEPTNDR